MAILTIGKVAKQTGLTAETIRYYEKEGLLAPPSRSEAGYRHYSDDAIRRLRFILRAKAIGFSLKDIKELLSLQGSDSDACGHIRSIAMDKIAMIDEKLQELTKMKSALEGLASRCESNAPLGDCPILDALDSENGLKD